jgi:hypothetical protein
VNPEHLELVTRRQHSREHAEIRRAEKAAKAAGRAA